MSTRHAVAAALLTCCTAGLTIAMAAPPAAADPPVTQPGVTQVHARSETAPVFNDDAGGNADADDPAIWRNPADPDRSLVVTTAKEAGLNVYDLDAHLVQHLDAVAGPTPDAARGRYNNVDLLTGVRFPDGVADVVVVSDRGRDRLRTYRIDPRNRTAPLRDVTAADVPRVFSATEAAVEDQRTAYGLASFSSGGRLYAAVTQRNTTRLALVQLRVTGGTVGYTPVRTLDLPSTFTLPNGATWTPCEKPGAGPQSEGMVADPENGVVYVAQEDVGIWKVPADFRGPPTLVDRTRTYGVPATFDAATEECVTGADPGFGGAHLAADAEGLTIAKDGKGGHLLASSQGDNTFVAYDRRGRNAYQANFAVTPGQVVDGSEECDGGMVSTASFGRRYPHGLLVVQDGYDGDGPRTGTNFKFVDWRAVTDATRLR